MKHVISHSSFRWCFAALATVVSVGLFAQDRYTVTVLPNDHSVLVQHEWNAVNERTLVATPSDTVTEMVADPDASDGTVIVNTPVVSGLV